MLLMYETIPHITSVNSNFWQTKKSERSKLIKGDDDTYVKFECV